MKHRLMSLATSFTLVLALFSTPGTVVAASKPSTVAEKVGYDVSYPQCSRTLPATSSFSIVGVNGGNAANTNPCLIAQLKWAKKAKGDTKQPKVQLYVNTANPGDYIEEITTWPSSNIDKTGFQPENPYGECSGDVDRACAWQYGWNRAVEAIADRFAPAAKSAGISDKVSDYTWWLDVETMNSWQAGSSEALERNTAVLEAMTAYYTGKGGKVGLYSTAVQWDEITGTTDAEILKGLPNWRPSGTRLSIAVDNCKVAPLTQGGYISLTQYVQQNLDKNHNCLQ